MENWIVRKESCSHLLEHLTSGKDIYVWGSSGNGKTLLINNALEYLSIPHTFINCIEYFSYKLLIKEIKKHLFQLYGLEDPKIQDPHKLALYLKTSVTNKQDIFYAVLDKAQKIIQLDPLAVERLKEISRISECYIKYIVISESYLEELFIHPDTIDRDFKPFKLFLPDYDSDQLAVILRNEYTSGSQADFSRFFSMIDQILLPFTRKIFHYRTAFNKCFESFLKNSKTCSDAILNKEIAKELGSIEVSFYQKFKSQKEYKMGLSIEAQILIVSGFICSRNPPRLDRILLKGKKKTDKKRARRDYVNQISPEKFSLQRLQAVYSIFLHLHKSCNNTEIINTPIETPSFCSLVNTLTQKKIFTVVTKKDLLGCEKLMCTAEYDLCDGLARNLGIKLDEYLID